MTCRCAPPACRPQVSSSGELARIPAMYREDLWALIASMLALAPEQRPSAEDLLAHPAVAAAQHAQQGGAAGSMGVVAMRRRQLSQILSTIQVRWQFMHMEQLSHP